MIDSRIPEFIVHYSRSEPFRSITGVPEDKWAQVIGELNETNAWGINRFSDPEYLVRRSEVERLLYKEFVAKGGKPFLQHPLYFFLGRHHGFEKHERNRGYLIHLRDLSPTVISFTYGDSLLAFNEDYRSRSGEEYKSKLCAQLFTLEDLGSCISQMPTYEFLSIEVQLWITPPQEIVKVLDR